MLNGCSQSYSNIFLSCRRSFFFFLSSPQRQQNCIFLSTNSYVLPSRNLKEEKMRKKPTQILQVINSGKMAAGILQAMGAASTNIFPDLMNLWKLNACKVAAKQPPPEAQHHFHLINFYLTALPDKATTATGKAVGYCPGNRASFFLRLVSSQAFKECSFLFVF